MDGDREAATPVFSRTVHGKEPLKISIDLSPTLTHAILRVVEGEKEYHTVLTLNTVDVVAAPDLDQAEKEGYSGPGWSANGTAVYTKSADGNLDRTILKFQLTDKDDRQTQSDADHLSSQLVRSLLESFELKALYPRAPAAGTPVLELMPTNAILRQVKSPGPWQDAPTAEPKLAETSHAVSITFGQSNGGANSLWLTPAQKQDGERRRVEPQVGTMVAAHADTAELAPGEGAISYIVDGALFVRRISR